MDGDLITVYIAIPVAVVAAVLGLLGYREKKKTAARREERLEERRRKGGGQVP